MKKATQAGECSESEFRMRALAQAQDGVHSAELGIALQVTDLHGAMTVLVPDVGYTMFCPEPLERAHYDSDGKHVSHFQSRTFSGASVSAFRFTLCETS